MESLAWENRKYILRNRKYIILSMSLYTLHFALYTLHFTLYTLHFALCTLHFGFYYYLYFSCIERNNIEIREIPQDSSHETYAIQVRRKYETKMESPAWENRKYILTKRKHVILSMSLYTLHFTLYTLHFALWLLLLFFLYRKE